MDKTLSSLFSELITLSETAPSGEEILRKIHLVAELLIEKNISYGDSALNPVRIFSSASTAEQLRVRIDDKLKRLMNGLEFGNEDTKVDLIGYLILLLIAEKREGNEH